jgi:hypothetical protein
MAEPSRNERIISRVRAIPKGFVRTYGDIDPRAPRLVGRILSQTHDLPGIAWSAPTAPFRKARRSASYSSPKAFRCAASASTSTRHDCRRSSEWPPTSRLAGPTDAVNELVETARRLRDAEDWLTPFLEMPPTGFEPVRRP